VKRHKAETRRLIREIVQGHLGEVKIQLPVRRKEKGRFDFVGKEVDELRARAHSWLESHGLPVAHGEREPDAVMKEQPHRSRIVHTKHRGEGSSRERRVSLIVSPRTGRVLGEQG
jgi:hypothetical protein